MKRTKICFLLSLTLLLGNSRGQESNTSLVGHWAYGPSYATTASGDYAYFGNGRYIQIAEISDPLNPVQVSQIYTPSIVESLVYNDGLLYVANRNAGLRIIDVNNPNDPLEIGNYNTVGSALEVVVDNDYAFVAADTSGLLIIDVSDPTEPREAGSFNIAGFAHGLKVSGSYAYVAFGHAGLRIIDISNPLIPLETGHFNTASAAISINVLETQVYVTKASGGSIIVDTSDPGNPVEVESLFSRLETFFYGSYAYCVGRNMSGYSFYVRNWADPSSMETGWLNWSYYSSPSIKHMSIINSTVYLAHGSSGIRIIDTSDPSNPTESGHHETGHWLNSISLQDNYAYVAEQFGGMRIVEVTDPTNPEPTGVYHRDGWNISKVVVDGDFAYVSLNYPIYSDGMPLRLDILDVSDPSNPALVGSYETAGYYGDIAKQGDYIFMTIGEFGIMVIDVSLPIHPFLVGSYVENEVYTISINDHYAYLTTRASGMQILDISDPLNPVESGNINFHVHFDNTESFGGYGNSIAISGNYAYITTDGDSIRIINVDNPENPIVTGYYAVNGLANGITIDDDLAYVTTESMGLRILDLSDPSSPIESGYYRAGGATTDASVIGDNIFLASAEEGLFILNNNIIVSAEATSPKTPSSYWLEQNFPNPFNPATTIKYALSELSNVSLTIFDIQGREIQTLVDVSQAAGQYQVQWSGTDRSGKQVGSGMYLCRIDAGSFSETIKMVYLQ